MRPCHAGEGIRSTTTAPREGRPFAAPADLERFRVSRASVYARRGAPNHGWGPAAPRLFAHTPAHTQPPPHLPERLDHVTIALTGGDVSVTWDTRQALLARLQSVRETVSLRASFDAVGASRPVELNDGQRTALLAALEEWSRDGTYDPMPEELLTLRAALGDDLNRVDGHGPAGGVADARPATGPRRRTCSSAVARAV